MKLPVDGGSEVTALEGAWLWTLERGRSAAPGAGRVGKGPPNGSRALAPAAPSAGRMAAREFPAMTCRCHHRRRQRSRARPRRCEKRAAVLGHRATAQAKRADIRKIVHHESRVPAGTTTS